MGGRRAVVVAVVAVIAVVAVTTIVRLAWRGSDGEGSNGAGFEYRGHFYVLSGAEVRPGSLGPVLDRDVPVMDTSTDVREILGIDPDVAVAAYLRDLGGTAAEDGAAWLLVSPDEDVAADPWAEPAVSEVVRRAG